MTTIKKELFGEIDDAKVYKYTLKNENEVELVVHSYGACIQSLTVPQKNQYRGDLVLGFPTLDGYRGFNGRNPYFGCTVGRVANRIKNGTFKIDDSEYTLARNNGENSLHGGIKGFDKVIWESQEVGTDSVEFAYHSKDGEEGYPGNLWVKVTYKLTEQNIVRISYEATSDAKTPVNLTNHSYFNLAGHDSGYSEMYKHVVVINAKHYTPVDETLIPTGEISSVVGTVFDLTKPTILGKVINDVLGGGFDHNFVVDGDLGTLRQFGQFEHEDSGRKLSVYSTQPGMQFYTGNFIPSDNSVKGKDKSTYSKHGGFCCETQNFPDAVNQGTFPDSILYPGSTYAETTEFHLSF